MNKTIPCLLFLILATKICYCKAFESVDHYRNATAILQTEKDPEILYRSAIDHYLKNNFKASIRDLNAFIKLKPNNADAILTRANAHRKLKNYTSAINDYGLVIKLKPKLEEPYFQRGALRGYQKDFTGAVEDFSLAIKYNPKNAGTYINRALVRLNIKQKDLACVDLKKAISLGNDQAKGILERYCK